jgi:hypothetical protein
MRSIAKQLQITGATILAACCGGTPTGPTAGPTTGQPAAAIQITSTPATILYAVCPSSHCGPLLGQLEIEASLTIRETGGVAITATRLGLTIRRRSDNAAIAANEVLAGATPLRIGANGSTVVPIAMHFDASAAEANMKVVVVFEGSDANGRAVTFSTEVEIRAP